MISDGLSNKWQTSRYKSKSIPPFQCSWVVYGCGYKCIYMNKYRPISTTLEDSIVFVIYQLIFHIYEGPGFKE